MIILSALPFSYFLPSFFLRLFLSFHAPSRPSSCIFFLPVFIITFSFVFLLSFVSDFYIFSFLFPCIIFYIIHSFLFPTLVFILPLTYCLSQSFLPFLSLYVPIYLLVFYCLLSIVLSLYTPLLLVCILLPFMIFIPSRFPASHTQLTSPLIPLYAC